MSEHAGFIQSPVRAAEAPDAPFKNDSNYIDIGNILAPLFDPDERGNGSRPPRTINLSVARRGYNMLD
jgi:hypothetical protein